MKKGTSLFLETTKLSEKKLAGSSKEEILTGSSKELALADFVIHGNEVVKNRFTRTGRILSPIGNKENPGPLQHDFMQEFSLVKDIFDSYQNIIYNRITEVIDVIHKAFDLPLVAGTDYHWYFENADEGEMGDMYIPSDDEDEISYIYERTKYNTSDTISNKNYNYTYGFPKKFLFMKNEDILSHIQKETQICKEEEARKKEEQKERYKENKKKKEELMNRLSPEEKKLLGIKERA